MASRHGARTPALLACAALALGWIGLALAHVALPFIAAVVVLQGVALAVAYAAMLIVEVAPAERTSEVTGVSSVIRPPVAPDRHRAFAGLDRFAAERAPEVFGEGFVDPRADRRADNAANVIGLETGCADLHGVPGGLEVRRL